MSTIRQHLGLIKRLLETGDDAFTLCADLFLTRHIDELIVMAGGCELEEFALRQLGPLKSA